MSEESEGTEETVEVEVVEETTSTDQGWSESWRQDWAGDDQGKLDRLSRYTSPNAAFDALMSAQQKISSGDFKKVEDFPSEGTEKEQAAWRADNGIPESAEKYEFEDETLKNVAFENNLKPEVAQVALDWATARQKAADDAIDESDAKDTETTEDLLRSEWGNEYRVNMNKIHGLLDGAQEGIKDNLMGARLGDGTMLGSSPDALKFLADLALIQNPTTTLVPAGGDLHGALTDEMKDLETMMRNKTGPYWKGPKSEGHQERYRELINATAKAS